MSDQRVLIVENPAYLHINLGRLTIERHDQKPVFILPEDIAVLCLEHHTITVSVAVLRAMAEAGVAVLITDNRHLPCAMQLPLIGTGLDAGRLRQQIRLDASEQRGLLWQQIVSSKLRNQAYALRYLQAKGALRLQRLAAQVKPADLGNLEAQAAKHYWRYWLSEDFQRRKQGAEDAINLRLNYGYAVLRAMIARSLVASGLNGALGLGHSNAGNGFNLVDDFIEPYRFLVEIQVAKLSKTWQQSPEFNGVEKKQLLGFISQSVRFAKQDMRLNAAIDSSINSFVRILEGKASHLVFPEGLSEQTIWASMDGESCG